MCEDHCIRHWGSAGEYGARRFDVGSAVKQGIQHVDVIAAACGPVERRLAVRADHRGVGIRACCDEHGYGLRSLREVAGPVGRDVQQSAARSLGVNDSSCGEARTSFKQTLESLYTAALDCRYDGDGAGVVGGNVSMGNLLM